MSRVGADLSALTARRPTIALADAAAGAGRFLAEGTFGAGETQFLLDYAMPERFSFTLEAPANSRVVAEFSSPAGSNVVFQRQLDGHDIYATIVKVHQGPAGTSVTGDFERDLGVHAPNGRPRLSGEAAARAAAALLPMESTLAADPQLVIFPLPAGGRWAFVVTLVSERPVADLRALVDGETGEILLSFNRASAVVGRADVYPVSPARGGLTRVDLLELSNPPGNALRGQRIEVDPGQPPPFTNPALDFRSNPASAQFDEPACYYHLWQGLEYFGHFYNMAAIASPPFRPIRAIVNDPNTRNNARFVPSTSLLRFGGGRTPWARSADIVVHELAHAITHALVRLSDITARSQGRGLSEGYSDYFAASAFDDPHFGDYVAPGHERNCADPTLRFRPGFKGNEHDTGAVWAAVLWDIRQAIGAQVADSIVAQSIVYLGPFSSFVDGLDALCTADRALAGGPQIGPHEALMRRAFTNRL